MHVLLIAELPTQRLPRLERHHHRVSEFVLIRHSPVLPDESHSVFVGLKAVEARAIERGEALKLVERSRVLERVRVQWKRGVRGEAPRTAARRLRVRRRARATNVSVQVRKRWAIAVLVPGASTSRIACRTSFAPFGWGAESVPRKNLWPTALEVTASTSACRCVSRFKTWRGRGMAHGTRPEPVDVSARDRSGGVGAENQHILNNRAARFSRTGRQKLCGRIPPTNSAFLFSSRCCGVTVAPTFSPAELTKAAASAVVQCSTTALARVEQRRVPSARQTRPRQRARVRHRRAISSYLA